ncbi:MAG: MaoC family dehydratase N-terminal domain-containing protein [Ilumatobacteraceae bacterium]
MAEVATRGKITDEDVSKMRALIGYANPTIRRGITALPFNTVATSDAIRHFAEGYGDANPLFVDPRYGAGSRWGSQIAPPGFEISMGYERSPQPGPELAAQTRHVLRGVQLYNAGTDAVFHRPVVPGDQLDRVRVISRVDDKTSEFAARSVIVTNRASWTAQDSSPVVTSWNWFVHAERRQAGSGGKYAKDEPAHYTDDELAKIEAAYDAEYVRGPDTLYVEDVEVGAALPRMVKGPMTVTDLINMHMGAGWYSYGAPALRIGYENRKLMRGFYTRDGHNAWDVIQRVHWDPEVARSVGVPSSYDIAGMRWSWAVHFCTNVGGDDSWLHRLRIELRRFNYMGDTTWIDGTIAGCGIDPVLGPLVEIDITGTNQRGQQTFNGRATLLVASRVHGPVVLPDLVADDPNPPAD